MGQSVLSCQSPRSFSASSPSMSLHTHTKQQQQQQKRQVPLDSIAEPQLFASSLSTSISHSSKTSMRSTSARSPSPNAADLLADDAMALYETALSHYFNKDELPRLRAEDRSTRSEEGISNYGIGGYHKVHRGQLYNSRYLILSKLGWGHFSTVWMAADLRRSMHHRHRYVAVKLQKGELSYLEAAVDEVKLLKRVRERCDNHHSEPKENFLMHSARLAQMLDSFLVIGPNGKHMCTVFEVLGENLLQLLKRSENRRLPMLSVKRIARDILLGLDYLHRKCNIIHTDLKPENVLVSNANPGFAKALATGVLDEYAHNTRRHRRSPQQRTAYSPGATTSATSLDDTSVPVVKIADLGNACWTDHHFTDYITTRQYRAPEIILKAPYSCGADMWSLACLVFELLTGEYLFDPKLNRAKGYSRNDDHLALILELMGPAPPAMLSQAKAAQHFFDADAKLRRLPCLDYWPLRELLQHKYKFAASDSEQLASFLHPLLQLDTNKRVPAHIHVGHPWLRTLNHVTSIPRPFSAFGQVRHTAANQQKETGRARNRLIENSQPQRMSTRNNQRVPPTHSMALRRPVNVKTRKFASPQLPVKVVHHSSQSNTSRRPQEGHRIPDSVVLDVNMAYGNTTSVEMMAGCVVQTSTKPATDTVPSSTVSSCRAQPRTSTPVPHSNTRVWRPTPVTSRVMPISHEG